MTGSAQARTGLRAAHPRDAAPAVPNATAECRQHSTSDRTRLGTWITNSNHAPSAENTLAHDDDQWQRVFEITLFSAVRMLRAAVPHMPTGGRSAIVTIGSLNARLPAGMIAPYSAAKAALLNVSKGLSEELASDSIRVNTVSPAPVRTPMWTASEGFAGIFAEQAGVTPEEVMNTLLPESMGISLGRVAEPQEIADLVLFLASERASFITGADYVIDGGMLKSVA